MSFCFIPPPSNVLFIFKNYWLKDLNPPPPTKSCNVWFLTISAASVQKLGLVSLDNLVSLIMLWKLMKNLLKVYSARPLATHLLNLHETVTGLVKQDFPWQLLSNALCLSMNKVILLFVKASTILWVIEARLIGVCFPQQMPQRVCYCFYTCFSTIVSLDLCQNLTIWRWKCQGCSVEHHHLWSDILMWKKLK